jgi:hypothetical protein
MNIINYYYNDNTRRLHVEFSTKNDLDLFYRELNFEFADIEYYSPTIIKEQDMDDIDDDFIYDLISQYLTENDLPEEKSL